ncbi:hypothetical protein Tco_0363387 [Tanacetum coccineum]
MSLRTTVLAQQSVITELQAADRKRQAVITEMLAADRRRQKQFIEALKLLKRLQTQMTEFKKQQGPAKGLAQPNAPEEAAATTTTITNAQIQAMIDQGITAILAARDANTNGVDSYNSGTGVVELTRWIEKMETVFRISICFVESQIKFSTCTLLGNALTWWNSHVRTVGNDIDYAMTWTELKKKMTDKVQPKFSGTGTAVCVVASKPKTIQEATKMEIEVMDKRIHTFADRQTGNKRKQDNNHQPQQQHQNKRQNTGKAYAAGTGHFKRECPKLKNNNNRGNQVGGGNAPAKVYTVGHAGTNPDFNVVTDHYYDVELADERIIEFNTILRGCTLNILNRPFNQAKYALEILKKHGMDKCDSIGTPMATKPKLDADLSGKLVDQTNYCSMIGSLMYLTSGRPDIVQAYPKDSGFKLTTFLDADHAGCLDTRKSTSRGIQFLGDKLFSWTSKKQDCTAMSSVEAEYVALSASCAQVMWMMTQLKDYGFTYNKIPLYCNYQSAIAISCNPVQHSRTKHIHTRYHFIKEQVERGIIELYFVRTEYQLADIFTKALPEDRFQYLVRRIGMRCLTPA